MYGNIVVGRNFGGEQFIGTVVLGLSSKYVLVSRLLIEMNRVEGEYWMIGENQRELNIICINIVFDEWKGFNNVDNGIR